MVYRNALVTAVLASAASVLGCGPSIDDFTALRELDSNGDGWITAADDAWPRLLLWADRRGDRVSSPEAMVSLERAGVVAIDLAFTLRPRCDLRGNCEGERARFVFRDAGGEEHAGEVIDVYLKYQRD
jgi:hypothetical protein